MGTFWFIVSLILFLVWMNVRSKANKRSDEAYLKGFVEGRRVLRDQLKELRQDGVIAPDQLNAALESTDTVTLPRQAPVLLTAQQAPTITTIAPQPVAAQSVPGNSWSPAKTSEELEAAKAYRTIQNLNTILYVGSFLIVAAMAIFVNMTMPAPVKLTGIIAVTIAFYTAGLVLHARSTRLRAAAIAFTGTGLAILPFVGFALHALAGISGEVAWLLVSIVGLAAYAVAAVRLQSELISYITMAFVLSLALSAVATLGMAILWYFVVIIGVSLVCNSVHVLYPKFLPAVFAKPLRATSLAATPVALGASLFTIQVMDIWMYEVLFAMTTAHYLVIWVETRRIVYEMTVRALAHGTLLLILVDSAQGMAAQDGAVVIGLGWLLLVGLQIVYSLLRVRLDDAVSVQRETAAAGVMVALMLPTLSLWQMTALPYQWLAINIGLIGVMCGWIAFRLRRVEWLYGLLAAVSSLPFVIGRGVIEPAVSFETIAVMFAALSVLALVVAERTMTGELPKAARYLIIVSAMVFASLTALCGLFAGDSAAIGWTMIMAAGVFVGVSYVLPSVGAELVGVIFGIASVGAWIDWLLVDARWQLVVTVVSVVASLGVGAILHHKFKQYERRNCLVVVAATIFTSLVLAAGSDVVVLRTATLLLLAGGIGATILRGLLGTRGGIIRGAAFAGYAVYPLLALVLAAQLGDGWPVLVLVAMTGIGWASSYIEKQPATLLVGHLALFVGLVLFWQWLEFAVDWILYGVTWIAAAIYYAHYWYARSTDDTQRSLLSYGSVIITLLVAACYGLFATDVQWVIASAGSLLAVAGVVLAQSYMTKSRGGIEVAVYLGTIALQRMVALLLPELSVVVYAHWWAITIFLIALWRKNYRTRAIIALSFVTLSTGYYALVGEPGYSLFFLIEHVIVVVAGALLRKQWAMWWGIVAVVLAVLYFLRNYTVVALLFLGFLLILFVIWRLLKVSKK